MKIDLTGKLAVVTGSTAGIGLAIAKGLAASGAAVVINGRSEEAVQRALAKAGAAVPVGRFIGHAGDLGTAEGCAALAEAQPDCDILVNNLGIFGPRDFFDTPDEEWSRYFEVNVLSGVRLSRAWAGRMAKRGWGRVVFMSSESAFNIPSDMVHYGFSKTALVSIARGLAKRLAGTGVTVNSVLPGPTLSEGFADMLSGEVKRSGKSLDEVAADFVMTHRASSIIQRAASVEEVANMVVYICSPQASATTGAALRVDGGVLDTL